MYVCRILLNRIKIKTKKKQALPIKIESPALQNKCVSIPQMSVILGGKAVKARARMYVIEFYRW